MIVMSSAYVIVSVLGWVGVGTWDVVGEKVKKCG